MALTKGHLRGEKKSHGAGGGEKCILKKYIRMDFKYSEEYKRKREAAIVSQ